MQQKCRQQQILILEVDEMRLFPNLRQIFYADQLCLISNKHDVAILSRSS